MSNGKDSALGMIVAVFAVVIIAAVLFPVFAPPRDGDGRKAKCLNNLKQCAQALKMYADDYDGQMPSSFLVSHSKQWNEEDAFIFCTKAGKLPPGDGRKRTWPEVLSDNMKSLDIVFCPSDFEDTGRRDAQASYWYKLANDKAWYGIGCNAPRRAMADYAYEADQIAFCELSSLHWGRTNGTLDNGMQANASFLDTHVATITIRNATSGDMYKCGEPMYYNTTVDPKTNQPKTDAGPAHHTDPATCYDSF